MSEFDRMAGAAEADFRGRPDLDLLNAWRERSLADIRRDLIARLGAAGIGNAEHEARWLMQEALETRSLAEALRPGALISWTVIDRISAMAWKRLQRMPLSQILGSEPFWTLDLKVTSDVLTPRSDTEAIVQTALEAVKEGPARILDLGTGSGAILLALLSERSDWIGLGVDISAEALAVARTNAEQAGLSGRAEFSLGDWGEGLADQGFDLIVSNPPYIVSDVIETLEPEVRDHEPRLALDGGADGLDAYRALGPELMRLLRPGGVFVLEIGHDQGQSVPELMRAAGLQGVMLDQDMEDRDRVVFGRSPL